jgi:hypothetical protein
MFLLAIGFFIGIIYENMIASMQIFETEKLHVFQTMSFEWKEYLPYILKIRMIPLICVVFLWNFKWRKVVVAALSVWFGFFLGRFLVSAILLEGLKGIGLCVAVLFPHTLFYGLSYLILLMHLYNDRRRTWNKMKTSVFAICFLLGVWSEVYINPKILKIIAGWI